MNHARRVIVEVIAYKVLGEYDHRLTLDADSEFIIIYGPNGVGKTKLLEIIDCVSSCNFGTLARLPFKVVLFTYSDGATLAVTRRIEGATEGDEGQFSAAGLDFLLTSGAGRQEEWEYRDDGFEEWAAEHLPFRPISGLFWEDVNDGEVVHLEELRSRYGRVSREFRSNDRSTPPRFLTKFLESVPTFLIETQRLRHELAQSVRARKPFPDLRPTGVALPRIYQQAQKIRELLSEAQTEHSRITQRLDRTFPSRVLLNPTVVPPQAATPLGAKPQSVESIRRRYDDQNDFRARLARIASVDLDADLALPEGHLEDWAVRLLSLYMDDAQQKLSPFTGLLDKIELLEQIVNDRLLNKRLKITADEGISVTHINGDRPISLDALSSGEQHEIIVLVDLLFNVRPGSLVLIDEPEISLHVAWQLAFIPDVRRIASLSGFRFIVATHSPQIINDEWDRSFRLGPTEAAL